MISPCQWPFRRRVAVCLRFFGIPTNYLVYLFWTIWCSDNSKIQVKHTKTHLKPVLKPCGRSFTTSQNFFRHFKNLSIDFWCFPIYYIQIISGSWSLALKIWWLLPLSEPPPVSSWNISSFPSSNRPSSSDDSHENGRRQSRKSSWR